MKVLIADDSAFMRAILKDIVTKSQWGSAEILEAENGEDALSIIKSENPDLVLLDIIMPKVDGISVLKEAGHSVKTVVVVSSVGQESVITEAEELGAHNYIVKPFDAKKVIETINSLIPKE